MAKLDEFGNLDFGGDPWQDTPQPDYEIDPMTGLRKVKNVGVTDPAPRSPDPTQPAAPADTSTGSVGGGIAWDTGASRPSSNPPGYHWDDKAANFVADPAKAPATGGEDDELRAFIQSLAGMPGADPSLGKDPDYWFNAIKSRGGLNAGNRQYWQDAGVGPTAFFNNPNREKGGGTAGAGGGALNVGGGGASNGDALSSFLMNWLTSQSSTKQGPGRGELISRLLAQADAFAKPVSADDPNVKASSDAYHGTLARSLSDYRTRAAERAHAEGVPTGAFDAQIGNAEEGAGRAEANFTTGLMNSELQSRRSALLNVLQQAGNQLSAADAAEIQSKIAAIDGLMKGTGLDLTKLGLDQNFSLGKDSLALQKLLGLGKLDLDKLGINNQRDEFYDKFGADNAFNSAQLDFLYKQLGLSK